MEITLIKPLIRTISYSEKENPIGFLSRLAWLNGYPSYHWIIANKSKAASIDPLKIFQAINTTPWIKKHSSQTHQTSALFEFSSNTSFLTNKILRHCPECINQEQYWKTNWLLSASAVCTEHKIWLQDNCPHCHQAISLPKQRSLNICGHCDGNFTQNQATPASQNLINQQIFIESGYSSWFNQKQQLPLKSRLELIQHVIAWLNHQPNIQNLNLRPRHISLLQLTDQIKSLFELSAEILFSSRNSFKQLLKHIHHSPAAKGNPRGQQAILIKFYQTFFDKLPRDGCAELLEEIECYVTSHLRQDINSKHSRLSGSAKENQRWLSFRRACRQYDISPSLLTKAIKEKRINAEYIQKTSSYTQCFVFRPDIEQHIKTFKNHIAAKEAYTVLGITKKQFSEIQQQGFFTEEIPPESKGKQWLYSKDEVDLMLKKLNDKAKHCTPDSLTIANICKHHLRGREPNIFLKLFTALHNDLTPRKNSKQNHTVRELSVDYHEFQEWLQTQSQNKEQHSIPQAAKLLGINEEFAYQLVNQGFIECQYTSQKSRIIRTEHLKKFKQHYFLLSKLAKQTNRSSKELLSYFGSYGIYPVDHNKELQLRQKLFNRKEILSIPEFNNIITNKLSRNKNG